MTDSLKGIGVGLLASLLLLGAPGLTHAGGCSVRFRSHVSHHAPVVVKHVDPVVATYLPVVVPLYAAHYTPPQSDPAKDQLILEAFRAINARLERLEGSGRGAPPSPPSAAPPVKPSPMPPADPFNPDPKPAQPQQATPFLQQAQRWCAACHSGAQAKGSLKLLEGGALTQLTPEQVGDVIDSVVSGRMPKGQQMSAQERLDFIRSMVGR